MSSLSDADYAEHSAHEPVQPFGAEVDDTESSFPRADNLDYIVDNFVEGVTHSDRYV